MLSPLAQLVPTRIVVIVLVVFGHVVIGAELSSQRVLAQNVTEEAEEAEEPVEPRLPVDANVPAQAVVPAPPEQRYWTTNWDFEDIDIANLLTQLESVGVKIPIQATGKVSFGVEFSVPLSNLTDAAAYRMAGRFSSKEFRLEALLLQDFRADVLYRDGVMKIVDLKGKWSDAAGERGTGSLQGTAEVTLVPSGDFQTTLEMDALTIGPLHDLFVALSGDPDAEPTRGIVSGQLNFRAPIDKIRDIKTWTADGELTIEKFQMGDTLPLSADTGAFQVRDGEVRLETMVVTSPTDPNVRIEAAAFIELIKQRRFQFRLLGNDMPLQTLSRMFFQWENLADGKLDMIASGSGNLESEDWKIEAQVASPELTIAGQSLGMLEHRIESDENRIRMEPLAPDVARSQEAMIIKSASMDYELGERTFDLSNLNAAVFGGEVHGDASIARELGGTHRFDLQWQNVNPQLQSAAWTPVEVSVSATSSGSLTWQVPAGRINNPASHQGEVKFKLNEIAIGTAGIGDVTFALSADAGEFELSGDGKLLGGEFHIETKSRALAETTWADVLGGAYAGTANLRSVRIARLAQAVRPGDNRRYRGTLSVTATYAPLSISDVPNPITPNPSVSSSSVSSSSVSSSLVSIPNASIEFASNDFAIDNQIVSRRLGGKLRLVDNQLLVDRLEGSFAGGHVWAGGRWMFGKGAKTLNLRLARIDASRTMLPISPVAASRVAGKVSGNLTITNGDAYRIRGTVSVRQSSLFSVDTGTVHSGITGSVAKNLRRWEVNLGSINGELAGGEIAGEATLSSSTIQAGSFDLSSRWKVRRVDFGGLLDSAGASTSYGHGRITGTMSLGGRHIRDTRDLKGRFAADLQQTQGSAVPGLARANRFLGAASLTRLQFTEGHMEGFIGGGVMGIQDFWLRGDKARIWADGRVQLSDGRMDMDAVIATGDFRFEDSRFVALATQLAIQSVLPVAALVEINRIFSNRTIYIDVFGPLNDPQTRLKPFEILKEEAARFLVREVLVAAMAGVGAGDSGIGGK